MKSLKNHISVILSLFVLLLSVESSVVIDKIIKGQDKKMLSSYSIVVVSNKTLSLSNLQRKVPDIASLSAISSEKILDKLKNDMTTDNLALLKIALPHFYSLKLGALPKKDRLERIKMILLSSKSISKVEVFSKTYENIFQVLRILELITYAFSGIIILISILLLFKQIRIWILEHEEKMQIMDYFGATFWMKSAFLYKLVLIDSLMSSVLIVGFFEFLQRSEVVRLQLRTLDVDFPSFSMIQDGGLLFAIALVFSFVIVTFVSMKMSD